MARCKVKPCGLRPPLSPSLPVLQALTVCDGFRSACNPELPDPSIHPSPYHGLGVRMSQLPGSSTRVLVITIALLTPQPPSNVAATETADAIAMQWHPPPPFHLLFCAFRSTRGDRPDKHHVFARLLCNTEVGGSRVGVVSLSMGDLCFFSTSPEPETLTHSPFTLSISRSTHTSHRHTYGHGYTRFEAECGRKGSRSGGRAGYMDGGGTRRGVIPGIPRLWSWMRTGGGM